ncbi:MAG: N-carbamoylputrescine amidase [Pseudomonadales bacterium]|nr:N-carbamoylputrescine amidase [Pseudomonadales bacterium]
MACSWNLPENMARAEKLIRASAEQGANIILIQELFETPYFCIDQGEAHYQLARPREGHPAIELFSALAKELNVVLPCSYFEKAGNTFFNSLVVVDADGAILQNYRKSHIPNGPGYQEKHFFSPGDTGFQVWDTAFGRIGVGICWDQWFPEAARVMALKGAELLFYPTAIGSEPHDPSIDSKRHWQVTMQGHSAANLVPVIASNRIGAEQGEGAEITFYGSSFITDNTGQILQEADRESEGILLQSFDLDELAQARAAWGLFRDRRPELYGTLLTLDGDD